MSNIERNISPGDCDAIREAFLEHQSRLGFSIIESAGLVLPDDNSTLFTSSGVQPLIPYLLGKEHPQGHWLANSQRCIRVEDIDEVGDSTHTTYFEMLGNWQLKPEESPRYSQLSEFYNFLTQTLHLNPGRLYFTAFAGDLNANVPKDEEAIKILQEIVGESPVFDCTEKVNKPLPETKVFLYGYDKNWWSKAGEPKNMPAGEPGGRDVEFFYEFPEVQHDIAYGEYCHPNCECGRFMEIGNSVFMEYIKSENLNKPLQPLEQVKVDFGGGLERIAAATAETRDVFRASLLWPITEKILDISGLQYQDKDTLRIRRATDHLRAAAMLITDGVYPTNKMQGYVLRRLIRNATLSLRDLNFPMNRIDEVMSTVALTQSGANPNITFASQNIAGVIADETERFIDTINRGTTRIHQRLNRNSTTLSGEEMFELHNTHGIPPEAAEAIITESGGVIEEGWEDTYNRLQEANRERSRAQSGF